MARSLSAFSPAARLFVHADGVSFLEYRQPLEPADRRVALSADIVADADATTGLLSRAIRLAEQVHTALRSILDADPNDTHAGRDPSAIQNYLGDFWLGRGQAGDGERPLGCYEQSLAIARRLAADNPGSAEAARDLVVSLVRMGQVRGQAGDGQAAASALAEAFAILDGFVTGGRPMDQQMIAVHRQLRAMFAGGGGR